MVSTVDLAIIYKSNDTQHTSHENDADRARRARAFCLIRTVPRRQYIAFSISVLDEWEWMAKRLAILT